MKLVRLDDETFIDPETVVGVRVGGPNCKGAIIERAGGLPLVVVKNPVQEVMRRIGYVLNMEKEQRL